MSIHVVSWVLRHSEARLGPRLTLIALAEFAHDDGSKAFPSVETLVERTRLSKSGVKSALRSLREDGHIEETGRTRSGTAIYLVRMGGAESDPGQDLAPRGSDSAPDPLGNRQASRGRARARVKIGGKPVDPVLWERTCTIIATFNGMTGKGISETTGTGDPSESAKRVYGRAAAFPDLTELDHGRIIRNTLASRWWGDDPPTIGVIYGPRVFEDNMERPDAPAPSAPGRRRYERKAPSRRQGDARG